MSIFYLDYENGSDSADGSSWANAWKTITNGATSSRIAPGDVIRIAKSPDPTSIGNATWTNLSKTVTLATAQTANIDLCESSWTANSSGDTTVTLTSVSTDAKQGSYCMKLTFDSAVQTSIMQAYYTITETDFSAYQKISFWIKNNGAITAGTLRIALCSDTAGATPVDYFDIPAIPSYNQWLPLTLTKSGGGNLGASIKSIALYTDSSVTGLASKYIYVDNFIACTTDGLNLQSLISKNSLAQGGDEGWYGIQSINGTTVLLDNETNTKANAGRGYSGTTETVTTYKRETIKTAMASSSSTAVQTVQDSGSLAGGNIEFQGGYNTSTSTQDGETFFDGLNGYGYGIQSGDKFYVSFSGISFSRYSQPMYSVNYNDHSFTVKIHTITCCSGYLGGYNYDIEITNYISSGNFNANKYYKRIYINNFSDNLGVFNLSDFSGKSVATVLKSRNNSSYGATVNYNNLLKNCVTSNNAIAGISTNGSAKLRNCSITETTEIATIPTRDNDRVFSFNHDQTANNHWVFTDGGTINSMTNDRTGGAGLKWKYTISSSTRASNYPLDMVLLEVPCTGNKEVTVTAYCKKDHATNVGAKLVCRGGQLAGVASDVVDTKANDTDWEQLSISFTPTEAGVLEIEGWAYYVSGNSNVYFADVTVSEAD